MATPRKLPLEAFDILPAVVPELAAICIACKLTPAEMFTLTHIKHFGKRRGNGEHVILRATLVDQLNKVLHGRNSPSGVTAFLTSLANKGLLIKSSITDDEKRRWYGDGGGRKEALVLSNQGLKKVDEFNSRTNDFFNELTAQVPEFVVRSAVAAVKRISAAISSARKSPHSP